MKINIPKKSILYISFQHYSETLDQFTKDFGHNDGKRVKSFFPYQFLTVQSWKDISKIIEILEKFVKEKKKNQTNF